MILLYLVFLAILLMVFGIVAFMMRPTSEQVAVQRRIATLMIPQGKFDAISKENYDLMIQEPRGFGWIDTFVSDFGFARKMKVLIVQSHKNISLGTILACMAGLTIFGFLLTYLIVSMSVVALLVALVAGYFPIAYLRFQRHRRLVAFNAILPDCIETCARSLRAGHSIVAAIDIVTELSLEPAKTEFGEVFKKQNYGLPLRDALLQMLERVPSSDLQVLVTGILVQKDTGGNLAEILDRTSAVIRDRIRIQGEIRTHTAQGRLTGWILFLLPVVMMLAINIMNPGYSSVLFHDPLGKKILYTGLVLLAFGGFFIRSIVNGIEV